MKDRIEFWCTKCYKKTVRNIGKLKPGERARCKYCGAVLFKKPKPMKPLELPDYHQYELNGQPVEFMTCDRCGERFNKRLAHYQDGTVFCPSCKEAFLV